VFFIKAAMWRYNHYVPRRSDALLEALIDATDGRSRPPCCSGIILAIWDSVLPGGRVVVFR